MIFSANIGVRNSVGFSTCDYSAEYEITLSNLVILFTSVYYSIEFLMFDLLSRIFYI